MPCSCAREPHSLQHIEYVIINEVIARGVCKIFVGKTMGLRTYVYLYNSALLFYFLQGLSSETKKDSGGRLFEDNPSNIAFCGMLFGIVYLATFMCQAIFVSNSIPMIM